MRGRVRRLRRIRLCTTPQRQAPLDFIDRMVAAYSAHPWTGYSAASVVHDRACAIRRGGGCTCTPEVFLKMPGGDLVEVDPAGRCKRETRQMIALDAALEYIGRGWAVVPVPHKRKGPAEKGWQTLRITESNAQQWFNGDEQNIGVLLGKASGGLTDVDLDWPEARAAANYFLPPTCIFGRASSPGAHRLFVTELAGTETKAAIKFPFAAEGCKPDVLELRIGGGGNAAQTIFPGSVHPSGEPIAWEDRREPARMDGAELKKGLAQTAAAAVLAHLYPQQGGRHDAAVIIGGLLARASYTAPYVKLFVEAVAAASCQPLDKRRDMIRAAEAGVNDFAAGKPVAGFPKLVEVFGEKAAKAVADWLGYEGGRLEVNSEAFARNGPARKQIVLPPPPDRASLTVSAWLDRPLPDRDFLLGKLLCTTSRIFIIGETGIGKTLFGAAIGGACAKGTAFLNWEAGRPARVMFIDGEMPIETFKERMELIAARHGREIPFFGYNREDLGFDGMPPLNTDLGQAWLRREIEAIKPDLIIFDSIMCLLVGPMQDEATWAPMKPLVCELSARKIAQVWFNHANDLGKSFGDKTREWEMDTTGKLSKVEGDETAIRLEFIKARHRTPANAGQFAPLIFRPSDDWKFEIAKAAKGSKSGGEVADIVAEFPNVYDFLADGAPKTLGLDARSTVLKVSTSAIRDELKNRGFLDADENDAITRVSRGHFFRAKRALLKRGDFIERKKQIWRL